MFILILNKDFLRFVSFELSLRSSNARLESLVIEQIKKNVIHGLLNFQFCTVNLLIDNMMNPRTYKVLYVIFKSEKMT